MRRRMVAITTVALLLTSACEGVVRFHLDNLRATTGVAAVDTRTSLYLDAIAHSRAEQRCAGPLTVAPEQAYGGESAVAVAELVTVTPLDPTIDDADTREYRATEALWAGWVADPTLVDPDLTVGAVATVDCGDNRLAGVLVLRHEPTVPAEGRFATEIYGDDALIEHRDLVYASIVDRTGQIVDLTLDLYEPPADGPAVRPTVVLFHGGGFTSGNKDNRANDARAFARRGFVAATASYRLRTRPVDEMAAANDAIDDGHEAIRWLKANAAAYGIDTERLAAIGTSVGGTIALGLATLEDPSPAGAHLGTDLVGIEPDVAAAVSTGAHLSDRLDRIDFDPGDAPALAFHHELDGDGWAHANRTCEAMHVRGAICDFVLVPGAGHTTSVSPSGPWWRAELGPFLWHHLDLASIEGPTAAEPFHLPSIVDESTLDTVVVEDWHVAGDNRQKLIDIHVESWTDGVDIRVPVRLIAPLDGPAQGFVVTGAGPDPALADHRPTDAEQVALDGGAGVVRTKIKPLDAYPGLPDRTQLEQRFLADLDPRHRERWLASMIMMRAVTAASADPVFESGPVIAYGAGRSATAASVAAINDDRITGLAPLSPVAPDITGLARRPGPALAAGHLPHDINAAVAVLVDEVDATKALDDGLDAFGVQQPASVGRAYIAPETEAGEPHPAAPLADDALAVFFAHHLFGASMGVAEPVVEAHVLGPMVEVQVTFPAGPAPSDSRIFWRFDDAGFADDDWATMTVASGAWTASIPLDDGAAHIEVVTTHTVDVDGRTAPVSSGVSRLEL